MDFDTAWNAWLAVHVGNGFAAPHFLNPPAPDAELAAAEATLGFALPDDLKRLWRQANGQKDLLATDDPAPGQYISPLFGSYSFSSVADALKEYRQWAILHTEGGDGFNVDTQVERRGDDPVHPDYWRPGWLPFSADGGGNAYAVDCAPAAGGTYGQVIVIGPDEDLRRVLAPGIAAFMADAAARRPPLDLSQAEPPYAYFDMEDRD